MRPLGLRTGVGPLGALGGHGVGLLCLEQLEDDEKERGSTQEALGLGGSKVALGNAPPGMKMEEELEPLTEVLKDLLQNKPFVEEHPRALLRIRLQAPPPGLAPPPGPIMAPHLALAPAPPCIAPRSYQSQSSPSHSGPVSMATDQTSTDGNRLFSLESRGYRFN